MQIICIVIIYGTFMSMVFHKIDKAESEFYEIKIFMKSFMFLMRNIYIVSCKI